jgi:hypothetical protein
MRYAVRRAMLHAIVASLVLGAVMTLGDWIWAALQIRHTVTAGILHGALMCLVLGAVIGVREGRPSLGALAGPAIGVIAACAFYLLAPFLGIAAMFPAWMFFWICFALLQAWMRPARTLGPTLVHGIAAAILSGLAFYAISGIWTRHDPAGPNYAWHFVAWSFAFFPGFLALFFRSGAR